MKFITIVSLSALTLFVDGVYAAVQAASILSSQAQPLATVSASTSEIVSSSTSATISSSASVTVGSSSTSASVSAFTIIPTVTSSLPAPTPTQVIYANPIVIPMPANAQASISCVSNAGFYQLATFTLPGSAQVSFEGNGFNNKPMTVVGGGTQTVFVYPAAPSAYSMQVLFQHSEVSPALFVPSRVRWINMSNGTTNIGAEDWIDYDDNDTVATIKLSF